MSKIPPPVVLDILSKLPVKSLCRFRCVSKPWLTLTNHPRFSKIHLSSTPRERLLVEEVSLCSIDLETVSCLCNSIPVEIDLLDINLDFGYSSCFVVSSCNGLVCIGYNARNFGLLLYNPSTRECKHITDHLHGDLFGFGYVESTDDYKIVEILYSKDEDEDEDDESEDDNEDEDEIRVYSLREDSWTNIQSSFDLSFITNKMKMVCVNGAIHSAVYYDDGETMIAAFDLVEDSFRTVVPPPNFMFNVAEDDFHSSTVGHLNGCLCLSIQTLASIELWVMERYNVSESWSKILTVELLNVFELQPLCYLNDGETILARVQLNRMMFWDSKDKELKEFEYDWYAEVVYVESLVSPNRINQSATEDKELLDYWFQ